MQGTLFPNYRELILTLNLLFLLRTKQAPSIQPQEMAPIQELHFLILRYDWKWKINQRICENNCYMWIDVYNFFNYHLSLRPLRIGIWIFTWYGMRLNERSNLHMSHDKKTKRNRRRSAAKFPKLLTST